MIDRRLPVDRQSAVEAHLSACGECRRELVDASALVNSAPTRSAIPRRWVAGAAAAAVAAIAVLPLARKWSTSAPTSAQRSTASSLATIQTVQPPSGLPTPIDSLMFSWRSVPGVMTYHLFVTDSVGSPIYNLTTRDTLVGPIADVHLSSGSRYFWYVDALKDDGSSVTSPHVDFFIRKR